MPSLQVIAMFGAILQFYVLMESHIEPRVNHAEPFENSKGINSSENAKNIENETLNSSPFSFDIGTRLPQPSFDFTVQGPVMTPEQMDILRYQISIYGSLCQQLVIWYQKLEEYQNPVSAKSRHNVQIPIIDSLDKSSKSRQRWNPSLSQLQILEKYFQIVQGTPCRDAIKLITTKCQDHGSVSESNVYNWFQNRKARSKRKHQGSISEMCELNKADDGNESREEKEKDEQVCRLVELSPGMMGSETLSKLDHSNFNHLNDDQKDNATDLDKTVPSKSFDNNDPKIKEDKESNFQKADQISQSINSESENDTEFKLAESQKGNKSMNHNQNSFYNEAPNLSLHCFDDSDFA